MPLFANNFITREGEFTPPPIPEEKKVVSSEKKSISFRDIHKKLQEQSQPKKETRVRKTFVETKVDIIEEPKYHEIHDGDLHKMINKKSSYLTDMINLEK
jgi:hypothetical protein